MNRGMKFYIYNNEIDELLYWDDSLLEFDTYESAERFLESALGAMNLTREEAGEFITIKQLIVYVDAPRCDATNLMVDYDEEGVEEILVQVG